MKNKGRVGAYLFVLCVLMLTLDGIVLALGATALGAAMTLSSLVTILAVAFWILRFSDRALHAKGVLAAVFVVLFLITVFYAIGVDENMGSHLETRFEDVGRLLVGSYEAILFTASLVALTVFFAVTASLERPQ